MGYWLVKSEPSVYSYADLVREKQTVWDGVRNSVARRYLRKMVPGDLVLLYHTGKEKAVVGIAAVALSSAAGDGEVSIQLKPKRELSRPVPLRVIKADPAFAEFPLVRLSRLSVMPVTASQWMALVAKGRS